MEHDVGDAGDVFWDAKVEGRKCLVFGCRQFAGMDGIEDGPAEAKGYAMAGAVFSTGPAGIDEPCIGRVAMYTICKHASVNRRMPDDKGLAEAGREGGRRFTNTVLRSCNLGRVARDKVVLRLLYCQLAYRWQNSKGIAGQQDEILWMSCMTRDGCIRDVLDWVSAASVFRQRRIRIVDDAGDRIEDDILEDSAEADGGKDLGLLILGQVDALGIAAAFDVEDTIVGPAVLVVANQASVKIGREGRLAGAGEPKEERHVVRACSLVLVG